jgi:hypothetical protein
MPFLTGVIALWVVLVCWVAVQRAWQRAFPDADGDPDALAGRMGCHGTCAPEDCERRCPGRPGVGEEEGG